MERGILPRVLPGRDGGEGHGLVDLLDGLHSVGAEVGASVLRLFDGDLPVLADCPAEAHGEVEFGLAGGDAVEVHLESQVGRPVRVPSQIGTPRLPLQVLLHHLLALPQQVQREQVIRHVLLHCLELIIEYL